MTYSKVANGLLVGSSSDTKPSTYADKTIFYETDTGSWYVSTTGSWTIATGPSVTQTLTNKTISGSSNTLTNIASGSLPATIVYTGQANTFGAFDQTFSSSHAKLLNPGATFAYTFAGSAITAARTVTFPLLTGNDQVTCDAFATTLTNKTLTAPVISTISNTGTLTLPTSTDTLVGRATTDTLTNKTLTSPVISTITNTGTVTLPTATDTLVARTTTDTLTNKTISASSNTLSNIADTNIASGAAIAWSKISKTGSVISDIANVIITSPSSGQVLGYNGTNWVNQAASGGFTEAKGITTPSNGDASTKAFTISHTLGVTPTWYSALPATADAADDYYLTATSSVITITYNFAPPSGTNNLSWIWRATV